MDLIDKKIMCKLDENCRESYSRIAKELRINRNIVDYRIKNLEKEGVISGYITSINLGLLGYKTYKIYFNVKNENKDFIKSIVSDKRVIYFLKSEGKYGYSMTVKAKSLKELDEFLMEFRSRNKNTLKNFSISTVVHSKVYKLSKLFFGSKSDILKSEKYSGESDEMKLEKEDAKILDAICSNANLSIIETTKKTGLSLDVVKYRLKKLIANKIINSFRALFDFEKLNLYHYVLMLKTMNFGKSDENRIKEWCNKNDNVIYYTKKIGSHDFEINAAISDIREFNEFMAEFKKEFSSIIEDISVNINTKILKLNYFN